MSGLLEALIVGALSAGPLIIAAHHSRSGWR